MSSSVQMPQAPALSAGESPLEGLSQRSSDIVRGVVESFLHRQYLDKGELACLSRGSGTVASDVVAVSERVVHSLEVALGRPFLFSSRSSKAAKSNGGAGVRDGAGDISDKVDAMTGDSTGGEQESSHPNADLDLFFGGPPGVPRRLDGPKLDPKLMSVMPGLFVEAALNLEKVVKIAHGIVQDCLHSDAVFALQTASRHMRDMRYVGGQMVANGADIVSELADSIRAYKAGDFHGFGAELGLALRKALLSRPPADGRERSTLPEGLPDKLVVANATEGLLEGLFGPGAGLDLKVLGDIDRRPEVIKVDLHECIAENLPFFQAAWGEVMFFYAQRSVGSVAEEDKMRWSTALALTMVRFPEVLRKCNMGIAQQRTIEDAVKGLTEGGGGGLDVDFRRPSGAGSVSSDVLEVQLAFAVKDWAKLRWRRFGEDLGHLLQEMALTVYNQKYTVDLEGRLHRRAAFLEAANLGPSAASGALVAAAAAAGAALGIAVALRGRRAAPVTGWRLLEEGTCRSGEATAAALMPTE